MFTIRERKGSISNSSRFNYGFKHNLHQKPSETIVRVEWLEKHIQSRLFCYSKKVTVFAIVVAVVVFGSIAYLVSDTIKLKFIFVPERY
ncbi:hypothetical protein ACQBBH_00765 (plasmid) [Enterococcus faecium]|uniref:hypothetical protein n=1 Tax=Enterococcus faecium TaxID=1352 RepID=UPI003F8574CE